ncbi:hypothetical protein DB88DRAFT_498613 [Papiliotrema laurentii]|uniref:K Homology domain-containing protein n=1 Tax=Papiliotrema laurentii TaxID=5418 RepID=A0AAD9CVJ1_PAPLA|nr:hypothetical protein DB88DRAFT_498613 [Papiliotrema laurentii]
MSEDRKSRWDAPSDAPAASTSSSTPAQKPDEAAAAAAAIAAKITASMRGPSGAMGNELIRLMPGEEGYTKDIPINDLKNRYVLTKGSTQKQISEETGTSVTTKGVWVPDASRLGPGEVPLYIHIVAKTQAALDAASAKVQELIDQELGPLIDTRTLIARNRALGLPMPAGVDAQGRVKWPEAKLPIGLDSLRNFNVRAKTVGPGGMFVKYIQAETGARVQIKGLGSGFMEADTGRESEEPMHINVAAPTQDQVERAKALAEDLLQVLRIEYEKARNGGNAGGQAGVYQAGYGTYAPAAGGADPYAAYYGNGTPGQQGSATPDAGAAAGASAGGAPPAGQIPQQGTEAWQQYAAYWAAYGYDVNDPQFQAWQQSQLQQGGQASAA